MKHNTETKVRHCYSTWGSDYYDDYYSDKAAYPPIHRELIRSELRKHAPKTLLDAGCGPASILRDLTDLDVDLFGFDLTPEMIVECKRVMKSLGHHPDSFWEGSVTRLPDFRGPASCPKEYDASICIGVLPHVPVGQDELVFANLRASLRKGGLAIVEARNELFSLFPLNRYSHDFFLQRLLPRELHDEAPADVLEPVIESLQARFRTDLPPIRKGKEDEPGYDEVLSRTHNPFELRRQFEQAGFKDVRVLFYHFHALPPMFEQEMPDTFRKLSLAMEANPEDWRGHFMASAFLLAGIAE